MKNEFILNEDLASLAKKGERFVLSDGYYTNEGETVFIKSSNKNYKLFSHKKTRESYASSINKV